MNILSKKVPVNIAADVNHDCYKSFENLIERVKKLNLPESWSYTVHELFLEVKKSNDNFMIPEFEIYINNGLYFNIRVFACELDKHHEIYVNNGSSMKNITLSPNNHQIRLQV